MGFNFSQFDWPEKNCRQIDSANREHQLLVRRPTQSERQPLHCFSHPHTFDERLRELLVKGMSERGNVYLITGRNSNTSSC